MSFYSKTLNLISCLKEPFCKYQIFSKIPVPICTFCLLRSVCTSVSKYLSLIGTSYSKVLVSIWFAKVPSNLHWIGRESIHLPHTGGDVHFKRADWIFLWVENCSSSFSLSRRFMPSGCVTFATTARAFHPSSLSRNNRDLSKRHRVSPV